MTDSITLARLNKYPDWLEYIFYNFNTPEDNLANRLVCKDWRAVATEVAKKQFILRAKAVFTGANTDNFLAIVNGKFDDYFSIFTKNKDDLAKISLDTVYKQTLIEKHVVCLGGCFVVAINDPNIPTGKQEDLGGKAFAEFHFGTPEEPRLFQLKNGKQIAFTHLPIELFSLKLGNQNQIEGEKDKGNYCFFYKERMIVLSLIPGEPKVRNAIWTHHLLNRDNAPVIALTAENAGEGHIWPQDIYIPRLDAKAEVTEVPDDAS